MNVYIFKNVVKVEVTGRNIDNYIKKLVKSKISIIKLKRVNYKKIILYISYDDYLKISKYRTIYDVRLVAKLGKYRLKSILYKNRLFFLMIIFSIIILYLLSNVIFDVKVIHSNPNIKELLYQELKKNGIRKYQFKKSYERLENIKNKILNNNKDTIEWLEIMQSGTKYIVRVEERVKNNNKKDETYQNIVASKNAVITKVIAIQGEKVKFENSYVNKGDIIITGNMLKPDNSSILMHAKGQVFGEVWYKIDVDYPYIYKEEKVTGKKKNVLVLNFLGKRICFFDFNKYNVFNRSSKVFFKNNLLPIDLSIEKQYELNVIDEFLTEEEAVDKAIEEGKKKLINNNNKIDSIKEVKIITKDFLSSKIKLRLFISVIEDIGIEEKIDVNEINNQNKENDN